MTELDSLRSADELHRLQEETTLLRALLAWGNDPCVYCGLQSCDMARCTRGFPGCWRSDDMNLRRDKRAWAKWAGQDRRMLPKDRKALESKP